MSVIRTQNGVTGSFEYLVPWTNNQKGKIRLRGGNIISLRIYYNSDKERLAQEKLIDFPRTEGVRRVVRKNTSWPLKCVLKEEHYADIIHDLLYPPVGRRTTLAGYREFSIADHVQR